MADRVAFITGITGQDGALLAGLLLAKGHVVHGLKRRSSSSNTSRIDHLAGDARLHLHEGDLTDASNLTRVVAETEPDEIYNLGAMSHVGHSFAMPAHTADVNALGTVRLLEATRVLAARKEVRFYQASTSELYGNAPSAPLNESTPFAPRSPYATAKLYAYWTTVNYRENYGLHASNGILFNHESPTRGEAFVGRKITRAVAAIALGRADRVRLGNLDARRDWGHARDYVEGMWRIVAHRVPDDYVLATGKAHSVREFAAYAFREVGMELVWEGCGAAERARDGRTGAVRVEIDPHYLRPAEVDALVGDASKARRVLGWRPTCTFEGLVAEMVHADLARLEAGGDAYGGARLPA